MALGARLRGLWGGARRNRRLAGASGGETPLQAQARSARLRMAAALVVSLVAVGTLGADGIWRQMLKAQSFALKDIELRGVNRLDEPQVLAAAHIELGAPLLGLKLGDAAARLRSHPWVEAVQLRRHLPNRLHIAVVEHVPRALAMLDELWLVNARGEPFKRFEADDRVVLPVITGLGAAPTKPAGEPHLGPRAPAPEHDVALTAQLRRSLVLVDHFAALRPGTLELEALHHDADLGTSVTLLVQPKGRQPSPAQIVVVHLGHEPIERSAQLLTTLDVVAQWGRWAEEVWLGVARNHERVMLRLKKADKKSS